MNDIKRPSPAESLIAGILGKDFLADLRNAPYHPHQNPQSYPESFMGAIDKVTEEAGRSPDLLEKLIALQYTPKDDPRLQQLVDMAIRGTKPNVVHEMSAYALPGLDSKTVEEFFNFHARALSNDAVTIPVGLKPHFYQEDRPSLSKIEIRDGIDASRAYLLIDERTFGNRAPQATFLIYDGSNYMMSTIVGIRAINGVLAWIDSNSPHSVPSVVKSISLFDKFCKDQKDSHGLFDDKNYMKGPLFRVTSSYPPIDPGFTLSERPRPSAE